MFRLETWMFRALAWMFGLETWMFRALAWMFGLETWMFRAFAWMFGLETCMFRPFACMFRLQTCMFCGPERPLLQQGSFILRHHRPVSVTSRFYPVKISYLFL
jgi:hypothetical protein